MKNADQTQIYEHIIKYLYFFRGPFILKESLSFIKEKRNNLQIEMKTLNHKSNRLPNYILPMEWEKLKEKLKTLEWVISIFKQNKLKEDLKCG